MPDAHVLLPNPASTGRWPDVLLIGLPDAVTAAWCLFVWLHPFALGADTVKTVVLMLMMEFILLNTTGIFTAIPFLLDLGRSVRIAMLVLLCAIYCALIVEFALPFQALWPLLAFAWLAAGKLAWVIRNRRVTGDEQLWLIGAWAFSVLTYLGAVGVGVKLPMPRLGITEAVLPSLNLPHGGAWLDSPHEAVASATLYFAVMAAFKWVCVIARKHYPKRPPRERLGGDPQAHGW